MSGEESYIYFDFDGDRSDDLGIGCPECYEKGRWCFKCAGPRLGEDSDLFKDSSDSLQDLNGNLDY